MRAGLDHSNLNLRSASKAVQPQPKCVDSRRCALWIFLCSRTCLLSHFMDSKEMPSKLPKLTRETSGKSGKLNLGFKIQEVPPPTTGPCLLKLSLQQRARILRDNGSTVLKTGSRYPYEKSDFPKVSCSHSEPQSKTTVDRTTGKN